MESYQLFHINKFQNRKMQKVLIFPYDFFRSFFFLKYLKRINFRGDYISRVSRVFGKLAKINASRKFSKNQHSQNSRNLILAKIKDLQDQNFIFQNYFIEKKCLYFQRKFYEKRPNNATNLLLFE